ncbi:serine/threonine-protein kinase fused [Wyeomyia smithii]|uniref:serine/threonine-protein kinase fused n=1 Tax=Wyeomyia smithii TaxID=174621 RepID=UPI0024680CD5|nr:serine/threonine-protein kinase fused [Wyeomyia smithii]XP_055524355.1 serine/threonine-protein kinase fused [Wyeomyia smithii]
MYKYAIKNLVGEGSFGKVYKAINKDTETTVALKIISKRGRSARELKGLRGECEIQRNLQHPNIIRMLDSFETENEIVAVTEFAGTDLHSLLRHGSLGEPETQRITHDLVSALYYLHSHRILHRDLKPQNILLDNTKKAKLCDFGFARNMTMGTHVLTSIKGTPLYMAPELLEAKPYDHHADLWSLGCIIYEMLAGEPPFSSSSMIHLVRLIRNQYIKWPSFLTVNCISFVQGLLETDPANRMPWVNIITHPFVKGHIIILKEDIPESPFTNPLTISQTDEKRKQTNRIIFGETYGCSPSRNQRHSKAFTHSTEEDLASSKDSLNVILQSDMEYIETDVEDSAVRSLEPVSTVEESKIKINKKEPKRLNEECCLVEYHHSLGDNVEFLQGNANLVLNNYNDNFPVLDKSAQKPFSPNELANRLKSINLETQSMWFKSHELERRKLSQNIDNFSIRLELERKTQGVHEKSIPELPESEGKAEKITPTLLPGWDSCDESQNPPIENEEWLVFLQKSMQEILDGELDSLKQQNFVSIIVAPLRNCRASAKVIENVAHLLGLPLAIDAPPAIIHGIVRVYAELKLVPNLVYASKLLCTTNLSSSNSESQLSSTPVNQKTRSEDSIWQFTLPDNEKVKTLTALYELICYLIHSGEIFLNQFCDAIEILGVKKLFVSFINAARVNEIYVRLSCSILAVLNCALRELPENAEIIEHIVFHENVSLLHLLNHRDSVLRHRTCMLLRILARFSCLALQKHWTKDIKESLEILLEDQNQQVKTEAKCALDEFRYLSFIADETAY